MSDRWPDAVRWRTTAALGGHHGYTQGIVAAHDEPAATQAVRDRSGERGVAVAVPADRRVRVPVRLPHGRRWWRPTASVDWLCVPRFDSPSVFGSLLDREAGMFRFGPFGINVPTARRYEPGTNVLVTTWKTPRAGSWCATR